MDNYLQVLKSGSNALNDTQKFNALINYVRPEIYQTADDISNGKVHRTIFVKEKIENDARHHLTTRRQQDSGTIDQ